MLIGWLGYLVLLAVALTVLGLLLRGRPLVFLSPPVQVVVVVRLQVEIRLLRPVRPLATSSFLQESLALLELLATQGSRASRSETVWSAFRCRWAEQVAVRHLTLRIRAAVVVMVVRDLVVVEAVQVVPQAVGALEATAATAGSKSGASKTTP
jgi:hypothetical protein